MQDELKKDMPIVNINLTKEDLKTFAIDAVRKDFRSRKDYIEHILQDAAKKIRDKEK
jgi:hypothetical protein